VDTGETSWVKPEQLVMAEKQKEMDKLNNSKDEMEKMKQKMAKAEGEARKLAVKENERTADLNRLKQQVRDKDQLLEKLRVETSDAVGLQMEHSVTFERNVNWMLQHVDMALMKLGTSVGQAKVATQNIVFTKGQVEKLNKIIAEQRATVAWLEARQAALEEELRLTKEKLDAILHHHEEEIEKACKPLREEIDLWKGLLDKEKQERREDR
jgi:hypothetical protein